LLQALGSWDLRLTCSFGGGSGGEGGKGGEEEEEQDEDDEEEVGRRSETWGHGLATSLF
jgi:hypothetical protein